ncbi:hypothetical protein N7522_002443 [Penicillium canescens]|nr:hypothetical protein N7522_002443 [Penicillium canescens]
MTADGRSPLPILSLNCSSLSLEYGPTYTSVLQFPPITSNLTPKTKRTKVKTLSAQPEHLKIDANPSTFHARNPNFRRPNAYIHSKPRQIPDSKSLADGISTRLYRDLPVDAAFHLCQPVRFRRPPLRMEPARRAAIVAWMCSLVTDG